MKRSEFFSEMGKGLFRTVKEVTSPLIEDDLDKFDSIVDEIIGVKWVEAGNVESFSPEGVHDLYIAGKAIAIISDQQKLKAYQKLCPNCQAMPQWISYEKVFKCFNCEDLYHVETDEGSLQLKKFPLKKEAGKLFVGLN
ncbi:Rieske (2Fe-2S) protein [Cytobacillus sp. Hz8]|uniref:Rieske (2Fe-2S) protein n=1 Tax=Cytobacillus sp. Hz8 TaxID=3347168 RepID=UPI0035DCDB76